MSQTDIDPTIAGTRAGRGPHFEIAVLIAVPKLPAPRGHQTETTGNRNPGKWRPSRLHRHRPRRRLRRSVRLAGWFLVILLPCLGGALGWASWPVDLPAWSHVAEDGEPDRRDRGTRIPARWSFRPAGTAIDATPGAVPALEPAIGAPIADAEVSVIIPGYLLPDDSLEEAAHEGG